MTRSAGAIVLVAVIAYAMTACGVVPLPDRTDLPDIALPSLSLPSRGATSPPPSEESEQQPPVDVSREPDAAEETAPDADAGQEPEAEAPAAPDDAEEADAARTTWWPFAIVLFVAALLLFVLGRRGRLRHRWNASVDAVRADLLWVEDALVPQVLAQPTAAEASVRWQGARGRILQMDEELYAVQTACPDAQLADAAAGDLRALRDLVSAVDREISTTGAVDAEELRARRAAVEQARVLLRARLARAS